MCTNLQNKVFYFNKRILQFEKPNYLSDKDLVNLFQGFLKLIINTTEKKIDEKYRIKISTLEKQIELLKIENKSKINNLRNMK